MPSYSLKRDLNATDFTNGNNDVLLYQIRTKMGISLFFIGIVLGGIATIVTVVFTIISLASGKNKNVAAWAVGFVFSISVLIFSVYNIVVRIGQKVNSGVEWLEKQKNTGLTANGDSDNSAFYQQERQYFLDTLLKYTNEKLKDKLPKDYYANNNAERMADSNLVLPFVYPLSIRYNQGDYLGEIISDVNDTVYLSNISQMAFDENFVIAKVDNTSDMKLLKSGRGETEYVLFDLRTREFLAFVSEPQLLDKSAKIGYIGSSEMSFLSELYRGWIDAPEPGL
ncbi:MAG: hypothetical protein NTX97_12805 [Bacteroidetes bacterium]|nr:hypothetical protein [Bacteroidota bacterium]